MPSTYSTSLRLELMATGEKTNTWGGITNTNLGTLLESAIAGVASVTHDDSADYSLTSNNGSDDEARHMVLEVGGTLTAARNVVCPTAEKLYIVYNNTSGGFDFTIKTSGGTGITVPNGERRLVYCDGTNVVDAITDLPSGTTIGGSAALTELSEDTTPQLGGDLDLNGNNIDFPSTPNISDVLDEDNMASDSATALATQQSIKAYVDANAGGGEPSDGDKGDITVSSSGTVWEIDAGVVGTTELADTGVTTAKLAGSAVTTAKIADSNVTYGKLTDIASAANYRAKTSSKILDTGVWDAAAEVTLTDTGTIPVDMSTFINATVTLGGNRTLGNPSNEKVGQSGVIRIVQDGTGGRTLSFASEWKFQGGTAPTLSTSPGAEDLLFYHVISSTKIFASLITDIS